MVYRVSAGLRLPDGAIRQWRESVDAESEPWALRKVFDEVKDSPDGAAVDMNIEGGGGMLYVARKQGGKWVSVN